MSDPVLFQVRQVEISSSVCDACASVVRTDLIVKASGQFLQGGDTSRFLLLTLTDEGNNGHIDTYSFNCRVGLAKSEDCSFPAERLQTDVLREGRQLLEQAKGIVEEVMRLFLEKGPKSRAMDGRFIFEKSGNPGQFSFYSTYHQRRFQINLSRGMVFKDNGVWTVCSLNSTPSDFKILIEIGSKKVTLTDRGYFCGEHQGTNPQIVGIYHWLYQQSLNPSTLP